LDGAENEVAARISVGAGLDGTDGFLKVSAAIKKLPLALDQVGNRGVLGRKLGDDAQAHHVIQGPERVRELQHARTPLQGHLGAGNLLPE
jgi:hypothetical protein